ncbi:ADP-ribosylation factor-like protein 14 isoform X2 [Protopterus annectens]|uniref:ADP-ribosylation factor-like protein 14 isoform X2 n=1 Tax=Protopterus annectens TaxID=7888 RepID=UPI001CFBF320|nr:ADP-ribosylation factor-like protein 14 isoform X2 [Protopterus annectens]
MGQSGAKQSKVKQARVLMLGLDAAGKSTILYKYKFDDSFSTTPTIGFNVEMIEEEKNIALTVWDVGGQKKMRSVWNYYLQDTDTLVYVVDSTDKQLQDSKKEFERILRHDFLKNVPVVLLANKQDLPGALSAEELTKKFKMKKLCENRDWFVQPCCAKTGLGLADGFRKVTSCIQVALDTCYISLSVWSRIL